VVGLPDVNLRETLCAWIRLKAGHAASEQEIRQFCCGKMARFTIPQHIRFVESFPTAVTGKVQKFKIRELEIERLGVARVAKLETT
jgi:fatty-acyl-CoA synthase